MPRVRQKWGLANAARDESDVVEVRKFEKAVAQWTPDSHAVAGPCRGQQPRHLADDKINDVDPRRRPPCVHDGVVSVEVFKFEEGAEAIASRSIEYLRRTFAA